MYYTIDSFDKHSPLYPEFQQFDASFYADDPLWLGADPLPDGYLLNFFLVRKGTTTIGRIAAGINPAFTPFPGKTGFVGWFECIDSDEASAKLIHAALHYLKTLGCQTVIGPINGTTWNKYRFTEPSETPPFFLDNYHKAWYLKQFVNCGFIPLASYHSTKVHLQQMGEDRINRFEKHIKQLGITIRNINMNSFSTDIEKIFEISSNSFVNNFLYTPIDRQCFISLYSKSKSIINPQFLLIAEDSANTPIGFIFAIPDHFAQKSSSLIIKTVAIKPLLQIRGLGTYLVSTIHRLAIEMNFSFAIHALMYDNNISANILSDNSTIIHRYQLLYKSL